MGALTQNHLEVNVMQLLYLHDNKMYIHVLFIYIKTSFSECSIILTETQMPKSVQIDKAI